MKNIKKIFSPPVIHISSPEEMKRFGALLSTCLEPSDVVALVGDLGAGKTHLVQGVLEGLGAQGVGSSPTFSLVHEYAELTPPVAHFDFYRLERPQEATGMAWEEYMQSDFALLVEWADRFEGSLMPEGTLWLVLKHEADGGRTITCPHLLSEN